MRILKDLSASIADEDVLIVEDIIDTGLTLNYLLRYLRGKNPASLRICTLLDKPARRLVEIPVDYRGFTIPDQFVVGYGLDFGEFYRNLRVRRRPQAGGLRRGRRRMTIHRRPLGRGRTLAAVAGVAASSSAASCRGGSSAGRSGIPAIGGNGFEGAGILVFLVGIAHARPGRPARTPPATARSGSTAGCRYLLLTGLGWIGLVIRVVGLQLDGAFQFTEPAQVFTNGPGLWLVVIGLIVLSRATYDMAREPAYR